MAIRATVVATCQDFTISASPDPLSQALMDEHYQGCEAGVLECREHDDDPNLAHVRDPIDGRVHRAWVFLQKRGGKWVLCHHPKGIAKGLRDHQTPAGISDQHRWQQDYWQQAGDAAGYQTAQEFTIEGTRLDVAITGPIGTIGVEVQHSHLSKGKVLARTRKADTAGIPVLWSADRKHPDWAYKVPHLETNELSGLWQPKGSWTVTGGPRWIVPARCTMANFDKCWKPRSRTHCGGWHVRFEPYRGLIVDEVAERFPAGDLVRLDTRRRQGIILVSAAHRDLWLSDFDYQVAQRPEPVPGNARPCTYGERVELADWLSADSHCACGERLLLIRPGRNQCERCRIAALEASN